MAKREPLDVQMGDRLHEGSFLVFIKELGVKEYNYNGKITSTRVCLFRCDYGNLTEARIGNVRNLNTKSCGCHRDETRRLSHLTYGVSDHPNAHVWYDMINRCYNKSSLAYEDYGGRGIIVCERWKLPRGEGMKNFINDVGERPKNTTLDRIDVNGNYEPANCRWTDWSTQNYNKRQSKFNKSGKTGVCWIESLSKWQSSITFQRKNIKTKLFLDFEDAVEHRRKLEIEVYGFHLEH